MALETKCQTPGVMYDTRISPDMVSIDIHLPKALKLSEEDAGLLEQNIHNALELVFAPYFVGREQNA